VTSREPFLAPRATGGTPSFNPLFGLAYAPFSAAPSPAPSGARAPPPTPLAPTPAGSVPDAAFGAREPAARGATGSELVGYLVDPFDKDAFEARVAQARASFDFSDRAVRVHAGSAALEAVERATKAKGARPARAGRGGGGGGGGSVQLVLGDEAFHLVGAAGAGADAVVFEGERAAAADDDDDDDDSRGAFALKVQRASLATWEWVVSERLASRVPAWAAPGFVRLSTLHLVGGAGSSAAAAASARVGVAAMPFGEHGTLQDALNSYLRVGERMDEVLVMYYAIELLRVVENLHAAGFLHADIKPDNVLLLNGGDAWRDWAGRRPGCWREKGVALIDFGCAVDLAQYETNVAFVGDVGTEGFRCAEMVEGRPWTFQCDTHQVAATVHALLHGKYMRVAKGPGGYAPLEPLKRYWRRDLWSSFFFQLLNAPTRALDDPPPLGRLRRAFEDHLEAEGFGPKIRECLMRQTVAMYDQAKAAEARK
jgi:checkpoint serine/threonine-protein kinase